MIGLSVIGNGMFYMGDINDVPVPTLLATVTIPCTVTSIGEDFIIILLLKILYNPHKYFFCIGKYL